jgi:hypothetical protein
VTAVATAREPARVFISSTSREIHAERDHLVKGVFPPLRKLCESHGATWGEVDVRWGVTEEAAAALHRPPGRTLRLGAESIPDELIEKEAGLRERFAERTSVTELAILHGVLNNLRTN